MTQIEIISRAICRHFGDNPDALIVNPLGGPALLMWKRYEVLARSIEFALRSSAHRV